ncbi:hypothetical protein M404DRAFT_33181 [Pisolithus tinctorius Marx 270]|uniref:Uncharacterized protein n=1 Tax=Pisolithus tinctorius Marx 270 TaxID=870435 RepID=A0A0C3NMD0_PISTI|nr:hypothetical protein M404DRAFT_33181 [Pisolithus tinctorius Marx 270]
MNAHFLGSTRPSVTYAAPSRRGLPRLWLDLLDDPPKLDNDLLVIKEESSSLELEELDESPPESDVVESSLELLLMEDSDLDELASSSLDESGVRLAFLLFLDLLERFSSLSRRLKASPM